MRKKRDSIYEQCQSHLSLLQTLLLAVQFFLVVPQQSIVSLRCHICALAVSRAHFDYIYPLADKHKRQGAPSRRCRR